MTPLALYIHIPYCLEKCPYCDFHSVATSQNLIPSEAYGQVLLRQLEEEIARNCLKERRLTSIFFGGGTPSLLPPDFFAKVLAACARHFSFDPEIEITVETNPATADILQFREWIHLGINRISFGVQSFNPIMLKKLGRAHTPQAAANALHQAADSGFSNISADLIFGIEGQTLAMLEEDLQTALSFDLPHYSVYQLTVEPNTPLKMWVDEGRFQIPEEETLGEMYWKVPALLEKAGLHRYEISNYARLGFESRHNLVYWRYQDYLGIGSGAVSFVNKKRWRTTRKLKNFLEGRWEFEDEETIDGPTGEKEKWMMGLRLREGIFFDTDNIPWSPFLAVWEQKGAIRKTAKNVALTPSGFLWYNRVVRDVFEMLDQGRL